MNPIRCSNCSRCTPKDKAIKRFTIRNMVESAAIRTFLPHDLLRLYLCVRPFYEQHRCNRGGARRKDHTLHRQIADNPQVISRTPPCSLNTPFPRCTSSCNTVSLAPFTARLSGMSILEMNLGRTSGVELRATTLRSACRK